MRTLSLLHWAMMLFGMLPVAAHDIGLMSLRFEELGDDRYQIEYIAQPGTPESTAPPILSAPLTWEQEPELPGGLVRLVFATDGKPLSSEDTITLPWRVNGVMVQAFWRSGETARQFFPLTKQGVVVRIGDLRAGTGSIGEAAKHYTRLGLGHVLSGWGHLIFLAGLLLLARGRRMAVITVGSFIVGHSLTLALATFGGWNVESAVVDALMALSIMVLAVELARNRDGYAGLVSRIPWLVFLCFGLIHGLGFAGALSSLGLPPQELPVAVVFFDLGIVAGELGLVILWHVVATVLDKGFSFRLPASLAKAPAYALGITATFQFIDNTVTMFW